MWGCYFIFVLLYIYFIFISYKINVSLLLIDAHLVLLFYIYLPGVGRATSLVFYGSTQ